MSDRPKTLAQRITEERRGFILQTLATAPAYRSNERMLHDVLSEAGLPCSRDMVRADLTWLGDLGVLQVEEIAGTMVVRITQGGLDVGEGRVSVPGISRPEPR